MARTFIKLENRRTKVDGGHIRSLHHTQRTKVKKQDAFPLREGLVFIQNWVHPMCVSRALPSTHLWFGLVSDRVLIGAV